MTQNLTLPEKAGKNLKNLIKESKYKTQERFAFEAMNVDPTTVRRWIAYGIKSLDTIQEICGILNIDYTELLK